jgi:hypothetical protein
LVPKLNFVIQETNHLIAKKYRELK